MPRRGADLSETQLEVETIAKLFEGARAAEPVALTGAAATPADLLEHAPRARTLHLATQGRFAPETIPSSLDSGDQARGLARMLLCGIALTGANEHRDRLGRRPGILTPRHTKPLIS